MFMVPYGPGGMFDAGASIVVLLFVFLIALVALAVAIWIAWLIYSSLVKVPAQHRSMEPWIIWLTLIPLVGLVVQWLLLPFEICKQIRSWYAAVNGSPQGPSPSTDYQFQSINFGQQGDPASTLYTYGLITVIAATASFIPYLGTLTGIISLVFYILFSFHLKSVVNALSAQTQTGHQPPVN